MDTPYGMYLAYFFQVLIGLNCVYAFFTGNISGFINAFIMFVGTMIPFIIVHRMHIHFPWFVFFLIALALWFHTAGDIQGFSILFYPYYDKISHLVSGITVALLSFLGVIFLDRYWNMNLTAPFIVGFTIVFGVAFGSFWEMFEFLMDTLFAGSLGGMMQNGLNDTMLDMISVLAGSVIVAILGVFYFRHHRKEDVANSMNGSAINE